MPNLMVLRCPNCDAQIAVDDGLDTCFCSHCGYKIILANQDPRIIRAKVRLKEKKINERIKRSKQEHELLKIREKNKSSKTEFILAFVMIITALCLMATLIGWLAYSEGRKVKQLEQTVSEIELALKNKDYDSALFKANSLHFDGSTGDKKKIWDQRRASYIKQISELKAKAEGDETFIYLPVNLSSYKGKNYEDVIRELNEIGLFNIIVDDVLEKAKPSRITGEIKEITIDGRTEIEANEKLSKGAIIEIVYYRYY